MSIFFFFNKTAKQTVLQEYISNEYWGTKGKALSFLYQIWN